MDIEFNSPYRAKSSRKYWWSTWGNLGIEGKFTRLCEDWFKDRMDVKEVILTQSCTAALSSVRLIQVAVGDEIILPSFTYVSTAISVVMSSARPVFVDIDKNTLNIAIDKIQERISSKTKAIICIHYGGYPRIRWTGNTLQGE